MNTASEFLGSDSIFAKKLKALREERGISQKTLATAINASRQAVAQYEDGTALPNIEKLCKIAEYFKVSSDWLLGLDTSPIPDINEREMSKRLGLTQGAIEFLRDEVRVLLEKTNRDTIDEALQVRQKILDFLKTAPHTQEKIKSFFKELNVPDAFLNCKSGYEVLYLIGRTPSFITINTLIEDRQLLPAKIPDEYCCLSILEALQAAFNQEIASLDKKFFIGEIDKDTNKQTYWSDEKGGYERSQECVYNVRLLDLQSSMRAHRVKMYLLSKKKRGDDE